MSLHNGKKAFVKTEREAVRPKELKIEVYGAEDKGRKSTRNTQKGCKASPRDQTRGKSRCA